MSALQTEREYLVSLGLAKPGKGRFKTEAREALAKAKAEGVQFASKAAKPEAKTETDEGGEGASEDAPSASRWQADPPTKLSVVRDVKILTYTIDGVKVNTDMCAGCGYHTTICPCLNGPKSPENKEKGLTVPA